MVLDFINILATYSLLIGITLFLLQLGFCTWWFKTHKQGLLE
jgi:uncharacterized protein